MRSIEKNWILIVGLLFLSIFFHFYNLDYEFNNDETIAAQYTVQFLHGLIKPIFFGSTFIYSHPPLRILVSFPLVLAFGLSETIMRFPHALFGSFSLVLVYVIGLKAFGIKEALLASALFAVSGVSAINRQAQGVGIYTFFVLLSLYYLLIFIKTQDQKVETRAYLILISSLVLATYTYLEAAFFFLPILYFAWQKKGMDLIKDKKFVIANSIFVGAVILYLIAWFLMPVLAHQLGYINSSAAGNLIHITDRVIGIAIYNNITDVIYQYISYNSIFSTLFLVLGIILALYFLRHHQTIKVIFIYLLPHFLIWTFFLSPIEMHPMYDLALLSLVAGAGLVKFLDLIYQKHQIASCVVIFLIIFGLFLSGWHNYVLNNQNRIKPSITNLIFWVPTRISSYLQLGSRSAGYFIRSNSIDINDQVFSYGTGSAWFYSGRLDNNHNIRYLLEQGAIENFIELEKIFSTSNDWKKVKYLIITEENKLLWSYSINHFSLEAIVTVNNEPSLYIFFITEDKTRSSPILLKSEEYDPIFNSKVKNWRDILPWFLPLSLERF
jgi:4-amino-4-deoxy-L-arabinose transferase-like glycosyltransferase